MQTNNSILNPIIYKDLENIYSYYEWENIKDSTFFISGSYGMLASYVVFFLCYLNLEHSYNIHILTQGRDYSKWVGRYGLLAEYEWLEYTDMDISSQELDISRMDYCIHAAGIANPKIYSSNPVEVIEPNVIGTYNLLKKANQLHCKGFLLLSSGDIYGMVDNPEAILETDVGKMDPLDIHSCYGESKRLAETLCMAFAKEYGVPTKIVRIGHTYGPTMDVRNDPRVFSSFMNNVLNEQDIIILSDGKTQRPFCYISDAVFAFLMVLLEGENGEAYNVCNDEAFLSINQLAQIMVSVRDDMKLEVVHRTRKADDQYVECTTNRGNNLSTEKLRNLGWKPRIDVLEGMKRTFYYLRESI